jgi:hypothetical protein
MKAISLTQPWATLIAIGAKRIETRSFATKYRGPLAIHAAQRMPKDALLLCYQEPFASVLRAHGFDETAKLPRGYVIATCRLTDCLSTNNTTPLLGCWVNELSEQERAFGDFSDGRYGWILSDVKMLASPVRCAGSLGLFYLAIRVDPKVIAEMLAGQASDQ